MTDWHVGMKAVCVDARPVPNPNHPRLVLHAIYTVAKVHVCPPHTGEPVHLAMVEHDRPSGPPFFSSRHYRPVVEPKADISIFTAMLNTQTEKVDA